MNIFCHSQEVNGYFILSLTRIVWIFCYSQEVDGYFFILKRLIDIFILQFTKSGWIFFCHSQEVDGYFIVIYKKWVDILSFTRSGWIFCHS